jgi:hypothetical protein
MAKFEVEYDLGDIEKRSFGIIDAETAAGAMETAADIADIKSSISREWFKKHLTVREIKKMI